MCCLGMWVNWQDLVYYSLGCIPGMRSPALWIFSFLSPRVSWRPLPRTHNTWESKNTLLEWKKTQKTDKLQTQPICLIHTHQMYLFRCPWQEFAICSWCLNFHLAEINTYSQGSCMYQESMLSCWQKDCQKQSYHSAVIKI